MYTIGQNVECVDALGIWSLAVILNVIVVDQRWLVKFEGWGKKWNREVSEIRNITKETETCQRRKRKVSLFYLIMLVQIIKLT